MQPARAAAKPAPRRGPESYVFERTNYTLSSGIVLLSVQDRIGTIDDLLIKADGADYVLDIELDRYVRLRKTWAEWYALSEGVQSVAAAIRDGSYVVSVADLPFTESAAITVYGPSVTFEKIWLKATYGHRDPV